MFSFGSVVKGKYPLLPFPFLPFELTASCPRTLLSGSALGWGCSGRSLPCPSLLRMHFVLPFLTFLIDSLFHGIVSCHCLCCIPLLSWYEAYTKAGCSSCSSSSPTDTTHCCSQSDGVHHTPSCDAGELTDKRYCHTHQSTLLSSVRNTAWLF